MAVLAVIAFHADEKFFPRGYLGVDLFFVISGFVVAPLVMRALQAENRRVAFAAFYARRFRRLAPALGITITVATLLAFFFVPIGTEQSRFARLALAALGLSSNFFAPILSGDYFAPAPNPLVHFWSLSVEEQFYLLIPALLVLCTGKSRERIRERTTLLVIVASTLSVLSIFLINDGDFLFYSSTSRVWEFGAGFMLFLAKDSLELTQLTVRIIKYASVIGLTLYLVLPDRCGPFDFSRMAFQHKYLGSTLVVVLALGAMLTSPQSSSRNLLAPTMSWIGDRSYSLYLWHMPLLIFARYSPAFENLSHGWTIPLALLVTLLASIWSHAFVEERFRLGSVTTRNRRSSRLELMTVSLLLPLVASGALLIFTTKAESHTSVTKASSLYPTCSPQRENAYWPCAYPTRESTGIEWNIDLAPGRPIDLLIGDSHATAISETFITASLRIGHLPVVWAEHSCPYRDPMLLGEIRAETRTGGFSSFSADPVCITHNQRLSQFLTQQSIHTVVITERSSSAYSTQKSAKWLDLYRTTIEKIKNSGVRVVVIGPAVEFPPIEDPSRLTVTHLNARTVELPRRELVSNPFTDASVMAAWPYPSINLIDQFCTEAKCTNRYRAALGYYDWHHLSVNGARAILYQLTTLLRR